METKMKFDPNQILIAASTIKNENSKLFQDVEAIEAIRLKISECWMSESADLYDKKMKSLNLSANNIINRISEFEKKLIAVSGIYQSSEKDTLIKSEGLPTSGVFNV